MQTAFSGVEGLVSYMAQVDAAHERILLSDADQKGHTGQPQNDPEGDAPPRH
jgi:hypothetical protein